MVPASELEALYQHLNIRIECAEVDNQGLTADQLLELIRQLVNIREARTVEEHGHDRNPALQRLPNFNSHEVIRVIKPPLASFRVFRLRPARSN